MPRSRWARPSEGSSLTARFKQGRGVGVLVHLDVGVGDVEHGLRVIGIVGQFGLKLLDGFGILLLRPEQVAEAEVHVRLVGLGFHGFAEHVDGAGAVLHLVESFAGEHVGFSGVGIEGEDLVVDVEDAAVLL